MADQTGISWCDATFNPWIGCEKVSPGCAHCYAETLVTGRMDRPGTWGADGVRQVTSESNWKKPLRWARRAREGLLPDGTPSFGRRPRVFCASLADVFEERPELDEPRVALYDLILRTPELDWLLLTKRPEFARDWLADETNRKSIAGVHARHFEDGDTNWDHAYFTMLVGPRNVWLGVSVENARHTWRADVLREIPAAVRFISAEPLLGSLFLDDSRPLVRSGPAGVPAFDDAIEGSAPTRERAPLDLAGIDWLIVGGESGGRATRPIHPTWFRELRDAAIENGVALHGKQWGSYAPVRRSDPAPGDLWISLDGRTRPWVEGDLFDRDEYGVLSDRAGEVVVRYAGSQPTSGGKTLDGVDHCEFPSTAVLA